jgi:hypothetical protein
VASDFKKSTTPPLEEVMRAAVREGLYNVNTCIPGVVQSFDSATNTISVQPALMRQYETDTTPTKMPIINKVPVCYPRGGNFKMKWALQAGDYVTLVFSQRSIDLWKSQGGTVDPVEGRRFHMSDAIAIPGGWPSNHPITDSVSGQTVIESGSLQIIIEDSGKIKITNGGAELLASISAALDAIKTAFTALSTDTTNVSGTPTPLTGASQYSTAATAIGSAKALIDSLKG